jgi:serine/threonine protein kinase
MPKTRRLGRKSGGKLIGEGAYGCVYQPAIRCEGNVSKKRNASTVSKLLYSKNAAAEYATKGLLEPIDPEQKYLLYPIKTCSPSTAAVNVAEYESCADDDTALIMYKYGGKDLTHFMIDLNEKDFGKTHVIFMEGFMNLFIGLERLHSQDLIHLDIKNENVLALKTEECGSSGLFSCFGSKVDASYLMRFIDFGLSKKVDFFLSGGDEYMKDDLIYWGDYPYYPFDLRLLKNSYLNDVEPFDEEDLYNYFSEMNKIESDFFFLPYWIFKNTTETPNSKHGADILRHLRKARKGKDGGKRVIADLLKKADVFALGLLLARTFISSSGQNRSDTTTLEIMGRDKFAGVRSMVLERRITWPMFRLIEKMTRFDFRERYTLKQALLEFSSILATMRELFIDVALAKKIPTQKVVPNKNRVFTFKNPALRPSKTNGI